MEALEIAKDLNPSKWYFEDFVEAIRDHNYLANEWTGLVK